jgi:hypothetical protein
MTVGRRYRWPLRAAQIVVLLALLVAGVISWPFAAALVWIEERLYGEPGDIMFLPRDRPPRCTAEHIGLRCQRERGHPGNHAHGNELAVGGATYWVGAR